MYWHIIIIVCAAILLCLHNKHNAADVETRMRNIHQQCLQPKSFFIMLAGGSNDTITQICDLFENAQCPYSVHIACLHRDENLRDGVAQRLRNRHQPDELVANVRVGKRLKQESTLSTLLKLHHDEDYLIVLNADQTAVTVGWDTAISSLFVMRPHAVFSWFAPPRGTINHNMYFWPQNINAEGVYGVTAPFQKFAEYIPMAFATFDVLIGRKDMIAQTHSAFPDDMKLSELLHNSGTPIYASPTAHFRKHFIGHHRQLPAYFPLTQRMNKYLATPSLWKWVSRGLTPHADEIEIRSKHGNL